MLLMFVVAGCVVVVDQASKNIVTARLDEGTATLRTIGGIRFQLIANRRFPWGDWKGVRVMTAAWAAMIAVGAAVSNRMDVPWASIALGASLGGAAGNVIDGLRRGAVIDFIDLRVWPVFNVADAAIVGGALLAAWNLVQLA